MIADRIEDIIFSEFIQTEIEIISKVKHGNDISLKKGRLLNFSSKLPFFYFTMEIKNKMRDFPLPIPFAISFDDDLCMSYRINDMCKDKKLIDKMIKIGDNGESRIFNRLVYVRRI